MRLAAGYHLYQLPNGSWGAAGPGDAFLRIAGPPAVVRDLRDRLAAGTRAETAFARALDGGDSCEGALGQLVAALVERGVLVGGEGAVEPPAGARAARPALHVGGDGPVARLVGDLADGWAVVRRGPLDEAAVRDADVVLCCAGWLPDAAWRQVEQWCGRHGTAWTRCHAEGLALFVGPLTVPGRSAGYADVRGRRLAAAATPDELLAHWSWLDRPNEEQPAVPWPGRGVVAVAAGLLLGEVERWWATDRLPEVDIQWEVGPDGAATRHPVLPLPVLAAPGTESPAASTRVTVPA
ncbi:hypothetical protein [Pseudofrankia sp. DC12]|uniref:hypothetical protein n=1 Tax=Pseudofrankia sp. DC12 TaxID=683315 RepID=UPI0005F7C244|nr:hypothetical protein [Pseudofrankia sp. DC12]